MKGFCK